MNNAHAQLIEGFYKAFDEGNGKAMAACYAPDVRFSDPVFPDLRGDRAGAMWRMLTEGPGEVRVELLEHDADKRPGLRTGSPSTRSQRPDAQLSMTSGRSSSSRTG